MPSLFEIINDDAKTIEEALDYFEKEGVPYEEAIAKAVEFADGVTADKVLSYGKVISNLEAFAGNCQAAAAKMARRGQVRQNVATSLRARLEDLLDPEFEAEDAEMKINFRKVTTLDDSKIDDVKTLPEVMVNHVKSQESWSLDKTAAKKFITNQIKDLGKKPDQAKVDALLEDIAEKNQGMTLKTRHSVQIK